MTAFTLGVALLADGQGEEAEKAYHRGIEILREHEDEPACQAISFAIQYLEDLTKMRPECAGPASLAKNLLEQARVERFGAGS